MEERILECCTGLFMKYGIRSITMDDIASHLGVSKKTIYQFFKDKEGIVNEVIKRDIAIQRQASLKIECNDSNPIEQMLQITAFVNKKMSELDPRLLFEMQRYYPEAWNNINQHMNDFVYQRLVTNLNRGVAEGLYRDDILVDVMARYFTRICNVMFDPEMLHGGAYTFVQIHSAIINHFLYGISTPKGHEIIDSYQKQL